MSGFRGQRQFGNAKRTVAAKKASMEMRVTMCTDAALDQITVEEMQRNGFYRKEAEDRLAKERERRGMVA